jgi:hypothetical protein
MHKTQVQSSIAEPSLEKWTQNPSDSEPLGIDNGTIKAE